MLEPAEVAVIELAIARERRARLSPLAAIAMGSGTAVAVVGLAVGICGIPAGAYVATGGAFAALMGTVTIPSPISHQDPHFRAKAVASKTVSWLLSSLHPCTARALQDEIANDPDGVLRVAHLVHILEASRFGRLRQAA